MQDVDGMTPGRKDRLERLLRQAVVVGRRRVPPGVRLVAGLLLIVGGCFGFLPVLGFWMIPLGLVFVVLDIPPLRRRFMDWLRRRRQRYQDRRRGR